MSWGATKWVRFCILVARWCFWTLAYRRQEYRATGRAIAYWTTRPRGVQHVKLTVTGGSVVKNVYVDNGHPPLWVHAAMGDFRRSGGMPRV